MFTAALAYPLWGAPAAQAVQEPPFGRPAHADVVPILRQSLPDGRFTVLPLDQRAGQTAGLSVPTPALAVPEAIDAFVAGPSTKGVSTRDEVVLALTVDKPFGCYRTETEVKTVDERRHLVTVNLIGQDEEACVAERSEEKMEVSLGRLVAGEHTILVGDGARTHVTLTVDVKPGAQPLAE